MCAILSFPALKFIRFRMKTPGICFTGIYFSKDMLESLKVFKQVRKVEIFGGIPQLFFFSNHFDFFSAF